MILTSNYTSFVFYIILEMAYNYIYYIYIIVLMLLSCYYMFSMRISSPVDDNIVYHYLIISWRYSFETIVSGMPGFSSYDGCMFIIIFSQL